MFDKYKMDSQAMMKMIFQFDSKQWKLHKFIKAEFEMQQIEDTVMEL